MILRAPSRFLTAIVEAQAALANTTHLADAVKLFHQPPRMVPHREGESPTTARGLQPATSAPAPAMAPHLGPMQLIASGAAACAHIDPASRSLTGLRSPYACDDPNKELHRQWTPPVAERAWVLIIPQMPGLDGSAGVMKTLQLNEEAAVEVDASNANWLLALGFTPYAPTSGAPVPSI